MIAAKVKISLGDVYDDIGHIPIIPITIPEMSDIQALAEVAHEYAYTMSSIDNSSNSFGTPLALAFD